MEKVLVISESIRHGKDWIYAVQTTERIFPVAISGFEYRDALRNSKKEIHDRDILLRKILGHKISRIISDGY